MQRYLSLGAYIHFQNMIKKGQTNEVARKTKKITMDRVADPCWPLNLFRFDKSSVIVMTINNST